MEKSHATYLSPQDLLKSYQPAEVPFSVLSEEEIGERENDALLIPIDVPDLSGEMYSAPLELEEEIIEPEEEISIIPINIPEASSISYSAPLEEAPTEEPNSPHKIRLNAPASSPKSHTPYSIRYELPSPRSTIITQKDIGFLSDAGVRGSVSTVCHGTFHSQPATLILFTFIFRSGDHGFRFKNASVKINFSSYSPPSSSPPKHPPRPPPSVRSPPAKSTASPAPPTKHANSQGKSPSMFPSAQHPSVPPPPSPTNPLSRLRIATRSWEISGRVLVLPRGMQRTGICARIS
ncbi:uncharacterized protein EAF02_009718 [Botrytis sinoallii]|uniref:uncharacterized protein n=1 Tax=Botrytis sinoallii TaxID=1463999 RepID=UPI0018FF8104|nr:uncharacterized protein EAF02_009718 [Botrytis sinoallii]KAF7867527.1 hypothetical protein EAF02_009718 [Botrytis sinoallii]